MTALYMPPCKREEGKAGGWGWGGWGGWGGMWRGRLSYFSLYLIIVLVCVFFFFCFLLSSCRSSLKCYVYVSWAFSHLTSQAGYMYVNQRHDWEDGQQVEVVGGGGSFGVLCFHCQHAPLPSTDGHLCGGMTFLLSSISNFLSSPTHFHSLATGCKRCTTLPCTCLPAYLPRMPSQ